LLENGHLLRPGSIGSDSRVFGGGPGAGGRVQEFTWEGKLVWDFRFYNARQLPHHDLTRLPNGNVLLIVSDRKTAGEAVAAGRPPRRPARASPGRPRRRRRPRPPGRDGSIPTGRTLTAWPTTPSSTRSP